MNGTYLNCDLSIKCWVDCVNELMVYRAMWLRQQMIMNNSSICFRNQFSLSFRTVDKNSMTTDKLYIANLSDKTVLYHYKFIKICFRFTRDNVYKRALYAFSFTSTTTIQKKNVVYDVEKWSILWQWKIISTGLLLPLEHSIYI